MLASAPLFCPAWKLLEGFIAPWPNMPIAAPPIGCVFVLTLSELEKRIGLPSVLKMFCMPGMFERYALLTPMPPMLPMLAMLPIRLPTIGCGLALRFFERDFCAYLRFFLRR